MKKYYHYIRENKYPLEKITIVEENGKICNIDFNLINEKSEMTDLIAETIIQLEEYFNGERKEFTIPITLCGTSFQKRVWSALKEIEYGKTCSYEDVAKKIGNEKACRAVGMANNRNPIPIIVPCHRVIGKNGKLVGYDGGVEIKRNLIEIEALGLSQKRHLY